MRDNIFNAVGGWSTILAVPLNLFAWIVDSNLNIILAIIVSLLSIAYIIIKIIDKISDMKYKWRKRKIIVKRSININKLKK